MNGKDLGSHDPYLTGFEEPALPNFGTTKDVMTRYTRCALCGSHLHFSHVTDFAQNVTQETARCPECGLQARQSIHRLQ